MLDLGSFFQPIIDFFPLASFSDIEYNQIDCPVSQKELMRVMVDFLRKIKRRRRKESN